MSKKKVSFNNKVEVKYYYLSPEERQMKRTTLRDILGNVRSIQLNQVFTTLEPRFPNIHKLINGTLWCLCCYYAYKTIKTALKN